MINRMKFALFKYKQLSPVVKAGFWFTMCNVIQKGIQFLTIPIYTRLLSTEDYGIYTLFLSWQNIISIFVTLNLSLGVFINGLVKYKNNKYDFTSSMQGLNSVVTLLFLALFLLFQSKLNLLFDLPAHLIILMLIVLLFTPSLAYWSVLQRLEYKYVKLVIVTLLMAVSTPILSIFLLFIFPDNSYGVIYGYSIIQILFCGFFYIYNLQNSKKVFSKEYWKYALGFNIPLIPHYLSQIILGQSDRIMINAMCSTSEVGIYSLAYQISQAMNLIVQGINATIQPWMYHKLESKEFDSIKKISNYLICMFACITLLVTMVGPEIIKIFATKDYYDAVWIIPPVSLSVYFTFVYFLFVNIEFYFEKNNYITLASTFSALLNIILNYIFIRLYGYIAAGYTTLFCYIFLMLIHYCFMRLICKSAMKGYIPFDIKFISIVSIIITIVCLSIMTIYEHFLIRYMTLILLLFIGTIIVLRNKNMISELWLSQKNG